MSLEQPNILKEDNKVSQEQQELTRGFDKAKPLVGSDFQEYTNGLLEDMFEARMDTNYIYVKHRSCGTISRFIADAITPRWINKRSQEHANSCTT